MLCINMVRQLIKLILRSIGKWWRISNMCAPNWINVVQLFAMQAIWHESTWIRRISVQLETHRHIHACSNSANYAPPRQNMTLCLVFSHTNKWTRPFYLMWEFNYYEYSIVNETKVRLTVFEAYAFGSSSSLVTSNAFYWFTPINDKIKRTKILSGDIVESTNRHISHRRIFILIKILIFIQLWTCFSFLC